MHIAPLVYFLEGGAQPPAYLNDSGGLARKAPALGPDGRAGALVTPTGGSAEYLPDRQRWIQIDRAEGAGVWLGVNQQTPPQPAQLQRSVLQPGHPVALGDGQVWQIPVARLAAGGSGLPRRRVLNDDGTKAWSVLDAYRGLSDFAERVWQTYNGAGGLITDGELDQWCAEALSVNYRLHEREALALGLFTDAAFRGICRALIDYPTIERILESEKKATGPTPGV